jgi:GTP pyrophosphokinase
MTKSEPVTLTSLLADLPAEVADDLSGRLQEAYQFALESHGQKRRKSGELYIEHDLAVAQIASGLGLDASTILACMLHDVLLPHTLRDIGDVADRFGPEVISLVTILDKLAPYTEKRGAERDDKTLEAIRRAILTIIEGDIRVILIHLADRLQDLRTASTLSEKSQLRLAREARDIHAPLANRLGIWQHEQFRKIDDLIDDLLADRIRSIDAAESL